MKQHEILPLILVLTLISDMMASLVIAIRLLSVDDGRFWRLNGLVFLGIFLRGLFHMFAEDAGYVVKPQYTTANALLYFIGRACLTIPCWMLAWHILRDLGKSKVKTAKDVIEEKPDSK